MNKLDLKTAFLLHIEGIKNLKDPNTNDLIIDFSENNLNVAYVFNSYEDYIKFFKKYINKVDEYLIQKAIYMRGKKGQIVALKKECIKIILKQKTLELYRIYYQEKIDEIHSRNKYTPFDMVKLYESLDLCAPKDAISSANNRCSYFDNCHECLLEFASHNIEYDVCDFKIINEDEKILKKVK